MIPGPDQVGVEVYYTGDSANLPATGRIVAYHPAGRFPPGLDLELKDADGRTRSLRMLTPQAGPGRRFWLMEDWREQQRQRIAEVQASFARARAGAPQPVAQPRPETGSPPSTDRPEPFWTAFGRYIRNLEKADAALRSAPAPLPADRFGWEEGFRYLRVFRLTPGGQRIALAFVDKHTGDILKPTSWKGPAPRARGSVFRGDSSPARLVPPPGRHRGGRER